MKERKIELGAAAEMETEAERGKRAEKRDEKQAEYGRRLKQRRQKMAARVDAIGGSRSSEEDPLD